MDAFRIGVIFDCDGTLIDSMMVWRETEAGLARRANVTLTAAEIDALTAMTIPECGAFFHERFGLGSSGDEVVAMMDELMLEFYRERALARPGALEFVQALAERGVRMSVASSSPQPYLQAGLERCGFAPYLDAIVSVDDVGASKREPAVYDHAREAMGTPLAATWGRRGLGVRRAHAESRELPHARHLRLRYLGHVRAAGSRGRAVHHDLRGFGRRHVPRLELKEARGAST